MSTHTYSQLWSHFVFGTKGRDFLIGNSWKYKLYDHIRLNSKEKGIRLDFINGVEDHIHLLVSMKTTQTTSLIAKLLKGESSNWINENDLCEGRFSWQIGYSVFSVSRQNVDQVRNYIKKQKEHHQLMSYTEELDYLRTKVIWK